MPQHQDSTALHLAAVGPRPAAAQDAKHHGLGDVLVEQERITHTDVARVLAHQQASGLRFGEATVALGLVSAHDVVAALNRQFRYPCLLDPENPPHPDLVTLSDPFGHRAECFRSLRAHLTLQTAAPNGPLSLAIVSPQRGDGRSAAAANLAVTLAQRGTRTVLVDADLRAPRQQALFGLAAGGGLSALLGGRAGVESIQPAPGVPGLFVLPAGARPPNPQELLDSPEFAALLTELMCRFETVVVDTPAASHGLDAALVARRCSHAVMVARRGVSRLAELQRLQSNVTGGATTPVGVLLNEH